jgi:hypothetical protein
MREYLDQIMHDGYTVRHDEHGSDPDLIDPVAIQSKPGERITRTTIGWTATSTRMRSTRSKSSC